MVKDVPQKANKSLTPAEIHRLGGPAACAEARDLSDAHEFIQALANVDILDDSGRQTASDKKVMKEYAKEAAKWLTK